MSEYECIWIQFYLQKVMTALIYPVNDGLLVHAFKSKIDGVILQLMISLCFIAFVYNLAWGFILVGSIISFTWMS